MKRTVNFFLIFALLVLIVPLTAQVGSASSSSITCDTVDPALQLNSPNGGESFYVGNTENILWQTSVKSSMT